ncbi:MAG TPA: signal peptidase II [Solirubrobacteraceae bacterium]|nr:signal peptidase II [Solirubrobacteraceae bacterium]
MADVRRQAALRAVLVCAVVIALDQLSKHTLGTWLRPGQVRHVIPGLQLVYERNTGVAFSFLASTGALVYVVTALALLALITYLLLRPGRRLLWLPTGMLVGGAIGNLIDRVTIGSVIDFIKLPHWPAFNIADTCITFGVILLVLVIERGAGNA